MDDVLAVAKGAAVKAGRYIRESYDKRDKIESSYKDPHQLVSEVDTNAERIILDTIAATFPDHAYYSEEEGQSTRSSDYYWIIDPLDGSRHFLRGIPYFGVSVGLLYKEKPLVGVVYNPLTEELFAAESGKGAYCNDQLIHVSEISEIQKSLPGISYGKEQLQKDRGITMYAALVHSVNTIRQQGSTALDLCAIARGQLDAMVNVACKSYDCAAGAIIAQEAGAIVSDFKGEPFNWSTKVSDLLVTNHSLHPQYVDILKQV